MLYSIEKINADSSWVNLKWKLKSEELIFNFLYNDSYRARAFYEFDLPAINFHKNETLLNCFSRRSVMGKCFTPISNRIPLHTLIYDWMEVERPPRISVCHLKLKYHIMYGKCVRMFNWETHAFQIRPRAAYPPLLVRASIWLWPPSPGPTPLWNL